METCLTRHCLLRGDLNRVCRRCGFKYRLKGSVYCGAPIFRDGAAFENAIFDGDWKRVRTCLKSGVPSDPRRLPPYECLKPVTFGVAQRDNFVCVRVGSRTFRVRKSGTHLTRALLIAGGLGPDELHVDEDCGTGQDNSSLRWWLRFLRLVHASNVRIVADVGDYDIPELLHTRSDDVADFAGHLARIAFLVRVGAINPHDVLFPMNDGMHDDRLIDLQVNWFPQIWIPAYNYQPDSGTARSLYGNSVLAVTTQIAPIRTESQTPVGVSFYAMASDAAKNPNHKVARSLLRVFDRGIAAFATECCTKRTMIRVYTFPFLGSCSTIVARYTV